MDPHCGVLLFVKLILIQQVFHAFLLRIQHWALLWVGSRDVSAGFCPEEAIFLVRGDYDDIVINVTSS